jgi:hypothetical protein
MWIGGAASVTWPGIHLTKHLPAVICSGVNKLACFVSKTLAPTKTLLTRLKVGLYYDDYPSKLVHFESRKNIFYVYKSPSLERFTP